MSPKRVRDTAGAAGAATDEWAEAEAMAAELAGDESLPGEPEPAEVANARLAEAQAVHAAAEPNDEDVTRELESLMAPAEPEPELPGAMAEVAAEVAKVADARTSALSANPPKLSESTQGDIEKLRLVAKKRATAIGYLERAELELHAAIRAAHAAGVPKQVIGKEAGVARQTVYNVLAKD